MISPPAAMSRRRGEGLAGFQELPDGGGGEGAVKMEE